MCVHREREHDLAKYTGGVRKGEMTIKATLQGIYVMYDTYYISTYMYMHYGEMAIKEILHCV